MGDGRGGGPPPSSVIFWSFTGRSAAGCSVRNDAHNTMKSVPRERAFTSHSQKRVPSWISTPRFAHTLASIGSRPKQRTSLHSPPTLLCLRACVGYGSASRGTPTLSLQLSFSRRSIHPRSTVTLHCCCKQRSQISRQHPQRIRCSSRSATNCIRTEVLFPSGFEERKGTHECSWQNQGCSPLPKKGTLTHALV